MAEAVDEGGEEGEEEVVTEFRGAGEEVVFLEGVEGALDDGEGGYTLKVPEVVEGGGGDVVPDALAEGVDVGDGVVLWVGIGGGGAGGLSLAETLPGTWGVV